MAKPTGFMEYTRNLSEDRPPLERVTDWNEFHTSLGEHEQCIQGARCMDCGTPFCHSGIMMGGAVSGCPINNLIPEWNELIYKGLWKKAVARLLKTNNFPEFTGRVCPAPCEGSCTLGINEPMVTIKANECAIIDKAYEMSWIKPCPPEERTGKKVAVIGSGPAGLACADELNKAGHTVTVYERADRVGGLLMYGIPNMKLDKKRVQRRADLMVAEGVEFKTGVEVGSDISADALRAEYDAIVFCTGATMPRDLTVTGRESKGIYFAVNFLSKNTKALLDSSLKDDNFISAKDKDVIVIGGGDTGTDCVGTSLRHGCKSITQFEIMPCPSLTRQANNPWPEWPKVYKTDYGQEEAAAIFGQDPREYSVMTKKIDADENGKVKQLLTVQVEWKKDSSGRFVPMEIAGTEKTWPAQLVLIAMGFTGPENKPLKQLCVKQDGRSNIEAAYGKFATNVKGVFAAGDARRGQSLVVWAINEGRGAARECDRFLMGKTNLPG
jgi:glutamate synthase (NADPH/NADH) small chain